MDTENTEQKTEDKVQMSGEDSKKRERDLSPEYIRYAEDKDRVQVTEERTARTEDRSRDNQRCRLNTKSSETGPGG